jgi:hypothetical protein
MFGPLGFLVYYVLRLLRKRSAAFMHDAQIERTSATTSEAREPAAAEAIRPSSQIRSSLRTVFAEERLLVWTGILGVALGVFNLLFIAVRGGARVPPEGDLSKAATFDIAIGVYLLTLLLLLPAAGFTERGRRRWRVSALALALYAYAAENIQIYRGLDPRFTRAGSALDQIAGIVLGLVAIGLIISFVVLALGFFTRRGAMKDRVLLVAIRYACAASALAMAAGLWMSVNGGSEVGRAGSILPLHAVGFHALQALPLVALLFAWSRTPTETARRWTHVAGVAWVAACVAIAWQTAAGRSVLEVGPATFLTAALLLVWAVCAARAALAWSRNGSGGAFARASAAS